MTKAVKKKPRGRITPQFKAHSGAHTVNLSPTGRKASGRKAMHVRISALPDALEVIRAKLKQQKSAPQWLAALILKAKP